MAARMTGASGMGVAAEYGKCLDCDHGSRDAKAMDCSLAVCGGSSVATLASAPVVSVRIDGLGLPMPVQPSLVGWAHAPDPYPPKSTNLG